MLLVACMENVRILAVKARYGAQSKGRQKLVLVQHVPQRPFEALQCWNGKHPVTKMRAWFAVGDERLEVCSVAEKPLHPFFEPGHLFNLRSLNDFDCDKRDQPDE